MNSTIKKFKPLDCLYIMHTVNPEVYPSIHYSNSKVVISEKIITLKSFNDKELVKEKSMGKQASGENLEPSVSYSVHKNHLVIGLR